MQSCFLCFNSKTGAGHRATRNYGETWLKNSTGTVQSEMGLGLALSISLELLLFPFSPFHIFPFVSSK
jgi:hypothetical protein